MNNLTHDEKRTVLHGLATAADRFAEDASLPGILGTRMEAQFRKQESEARLLLVKLETKFYGDDE